MAELLKSGAVFLHVPKTGGAWVRQALHAQKLVRCRVGRWHSTAEHVSDIVRFDGWRFVRHWPLHPMVTPGSLRRAFKFCFVRNPLNWYESWWKYIAGERRVWEPGRWHPQRCIDDCASDDFRTFVENVLKKRPGYVCEMYSWYSEGADFVGRYEHLTDDLVEALRRTNVQFDEQALRSSPPVNVSTARRGKPVWDPMLLERVIEAEAKGIARYGYEEDVCAMLVATERSNASYVAPTERRPLKGVA